MRVIAPWPKNPLYAAGYAAFLVVLMIMFVGLRRFVLGTLLVLALSMVIMLAIGGAWVVHTAEWVLGGL